jgi:serine protease
MKRSILFSIMILIGLAVVVLASATPAYTSNEGGMARVWVEFKPGTKASVERALTGAGAQFHYTFEEFNAFAVSLPEAALAGIQRNPNVVLIEEDAKRYPSSQTVPYGIDMVQARDVWDANRDGAVDANAPTGSGRTICIIDSGLFTGHEDLAGLKVKGGYPSNYTTDNCGHGTHVAGTIAAALNGLGVIGVAPAGPDIGPDLYIVKVFGDDCSWTYSSDLADAAQRCEAGGADIISMSLGGGRSNRFEQRAFDSLYNKGVLSIASAGNDGNTTTSYPAGYNSVISVAAVDSNKVVADFSQKNSTVELSAPGVGVLSTVPFTSTNTLTVDGVTYTGSQIEFAAITDNLGVTGALVNGSLCDTTGSYGGKVVLCERGVISFYDKVMNVQNSGGVAAVIYNNVAGGFSGTLGEGNSSTIPAISISREDGLIVMGKTGLVSTVKSTALVYGTSGYEAWDGTSMAAPHVSGVAALVWSAYPELTNAQIRSALTGTALDLGAAGRDNSYGYGLVQAKSALDSLAGGSGGGGGGTGSLVVTVKTDKASYTNRQTVTITVTVTDGTNLVSGAAVSTTILTANGKQYAGSGTTNSSGVATFSHKVNTKSDGTGTYSVTATAAASGISGTGSTTFSVQ